MITSIDKIREACLEIAYDNGMINRQAPEAVVLAEMLDHVTENFGLLDIQMVEDELSMLAPYDFAQAVTGDTQGMISELANNLLNAAFEGVE